MEKEYKILGNYIRLVDERNRNLVVTKLLGVSISKKFIPSIANIVGTDLSNYKIVRTGQFAYGPVTSRNGEKISIAYLDEEDCIISSSYTVFEVENKEELDPEYLMLWFSRPEFDRYARYKSHGSVREIFDWNELCMVELPVPDIEKQRKIVKAYKTINDRVALKQKINDNLAMTLSTLFLELYSQLNDENNMQFDEICTLASSKRVFANDYVACGIPFYRGKEITLKQSGQPITEPLFIEASYFEDIKNKYGVPMKGDILITAVGTIGNSYLVKDEEFYFKDGNIIWLKNFSHGLNYYVYDFMQTSIFKQLLEGICIGSTQTALTIAALSKLLIKIPDIYTLETYANRSCSIHNHIEYNNKELVYLHSLNNVLLSKLSS